MHFDGKPTYGTLKVYVNSGKREGKERLVADVVLLGRGSNNQFRMLNISFSDGHFTTPSIVGQYMVLNSTNDTYSFEEADGEKRESLENKYKGMCEAEEKAPWKFSGRKYERTSKGDFFPIEGTDFEVEIPGDIDTPLRYAYEHYPEYFFGGSVAKQFVGGDFSLVPVPGYYCDMYKTNDQQEALLLLGKEKGWNISSVEEIMDGSMEERN